MCLQRPSEHCVCEIVFLHNGMTLILTRHDVPSRALDVDASSEPQWLVHRVDEMFVYGPAPPELVCMAVLSRADVFF